MIGSPNRITAYADKLRDQIATGLKPDGTPMGDLEKLDATMALSFEELFAYQTLKSQAHLKGILTADEAQTIYAALGEGWSEENGGWAPGVDLAMKVTITELMAQLTGVRRG